MKPTAPLLPHVLRHVFLAMSLCALTSCAVGPNYQRPPQAMPTTYKSATSQPAVAAPLTMRWWQLFGDPELNSLEESTLNENPTILAAMARVEQARAAARVTKSQFYPTITLDPSIERGRTPINTSVNNSGRTSVTSTEVLIPFDLTYQVDAWGRVRRAYEAARAQYQASQDDFEVVMLTLQADVAQNYFALRSLDAQDKILASTVDAYRQQLDLTQTQLKAGLVSPTDQAQALAVLHGAIALEIEVRRMRADTEHALAILLGRSPSELTLPSDPLDLLPPVIPAGLPADLLRQRPDVAEAEQNLAAASASIGVAKAELYPTISLTGDAGFESFDVGHALDWEQRIWSVGAGASAPIFEGGRLQANLDQARARYQELAATYRNSVLGAIRDVEDSLTDMHLRADEASAEAEAVKASAEYLRLSNIQYHQGLVGYLQVIDAERTLLANKLIAEQTHNLRMASTVLLIKALGGGWEAPASQAK